MRALLAVVALAACAGESRPPPQPAAAEPPVWRVRGPGGLEPIEPGTRDPALLRASACASCHPAEHAEWASSRHAAAWTNGIFQREYRDVPRRWCVHCHAPLTPQVAEVAGGHPGDLAGEGISCAVCHVRGGKLVARRRGATSPHDTVVRDDFGSAAFCADCHQFPFPRFGAGLEPVGLSAHPMQDTVAQVARGPFAGSHACLACHDSPASHAFRGAHDAGMREGALRHAACRDGDDLVLAIRNVGAGHNVPTGDVHRHLVARVWRASAPESLFEIFIGRRFEPDDHGGKRTTWDSTIPPQTTRRYRTPLAGLAGDPAEAVSFELRYVFTADEIPRRTRDPGEPTSQVIAEASYLATALPRCD